MKKLALYPEGLPKSAIELSPLRERDPTCEECPMHSGARNRCMKPSGKGGGVLVVGEKPTRLEDTANKAFYGQQHMRVRALVEKSYKGNVMFTYALRCAGGVRKKKTPPKWLDACRPFLADTVESSAPERILCLGPDAAQAVLGRRVQGMQVRRAYGWITNCLGDHIPVFVLSLPQIAFSNPFWAKEFENDLKWAMRAQVSPWFLTTYTKIVETPLDSRKAVRRIRKSQWGTYDVETSGRIGNKDFVIESLTLLGSTNTSYTWTDKALRDPKVLEPLRELFRTMPMATQNGKYDDRSILAALDIYAEHIYYDTRLGHKLLYPDAAAKLEILAEIVGMGGHKEEAASVNGKIIAELNRQAFPPSEFTPGGKRRKIKPPAFNVKQGHLEQIREGAEPEAFMFHYMPRETLFRYNARDVFSTREVCALEKPVLEDHLTISRAWNLVVKDANKAVRQIEAWGFPVDRTAVLALANKCDTRLAEIELEMADHTDINPKSPKQLAEYLFGELGLPVGKQTDSGAWSTDETTLETLKDKHPYVSLLLEHRKLSKFAGTYARGLLRHIRDDGRVHPSFLLDGAGTGRLSCQEPNLQNIPRAKGSELGKMARDCFVSKPGWCLIEADYSQLELRIAAMLSGDEEMIKDYEKGIDIHMNGATECCEIAWKIPRKKWDKMSKDDRDPYRSQVKAVIFGVLYGKHDSTLAKDFNTSVATIKEINRVIWGRYKRLKRFMDERIVESRKTGTAWTWWAGERSRVRPIPKILDQDPNMRSHYERTAGNTTVQGTAAEFATASLWPIVQWLQTDKLLKGRGELVSTVHDACILHVPEKFRDHAAKNLQRLMLSHEANGMPLAVDVKWGYAWGSMKDLELAA